MFTKDCIDEEKEMRMGRQVLWGIGIVLFCCLLFWQMGFFDYQPPERIPKETPAQTFLDLQQEQVKELQAIRIAIEKLVNQRNP